MNHADIVQLIFSIFLGVLLSLVVANFAVIVASLSRREGLAKSITAFLASYLWLWRMGGDGDPASRSSRINTLLSPQRRGEGSKGAGAKRVQSLPGPPTLSNCPARLCPAY